MGRRLLNKIKVNGRMEGKEEMRERRMDKEKKKQLRLKN